MKKSVYTSPSWCIIDQELLEPILSVSGGLQDYVYYDPIEE